MSEILAPLSPAEVGLASRLPRIIGFIEVKPGIARDDDVLRGEICADAAHPLYCS